VSLATGHRPRYAGDPGIAGTYTTKFCLDPDACPMLFEAGMRKINLEAHWRAFREDLDDSLYMVVCLF
jgi:hypothetical protein